MNKNSVSRERAGDGVSVYGVYEKGRYCMCMVNSQLSIRRSPLTIEKDHKHDCVGESSASPSCLPIEALDLCTTRMFFQLPGEKAYKSSPVLPGPSCS